MWRLRKVRRFRYNFSFKTSKLPPPSASSKETGSSSPKRQICRRFTIAEIQSATQDFNEKLLIGRGGFGNVYKGTIKNGTTIIVALKRWISDSGQGATGFQAEVDLLPMLRHPNIVRLIGYCNDEKEMILAYEYMPNGSLEEHLHQHHTPLSWSQRLKICIDVARALDYLHNGTSGQEVIHRDVKSSNILLNSEWAAKIADLGVSKIIPFGNDSTHVITFVAGTIGYIDPEYLATSRLSKKSDVYSFGVVLLEVLCRRRARDTNRDEEQVSLARWAQYCLRIGKQEQIIDPELRGEISLECLDHYTLIVKCCLRERQEARITMAEALFGLESILASHENTDTSSPPMGISTSYRRLQKYFFSSADNSGGSYFRKDVEYFSAESRRHGGDRAAMPGNDFDAISEKSYAFEMSPMQSMRFTGEDSEADSEREQDHEVIDLELLTGDRSMKSFSESMQLEYIQQAVGLMRIFDLLHLIWFYPVKKEVEVNFGSLLDKFSSFNEHIRKLQDSSSEQDTLKEIQTLLQDIGEDLDAAAFDMVAYVPEALAENRSMSVGFENPATGANSEQGSLESFWSGIPEVYASAVDSATHRAISCIKDLKVKKLGTAGSGAVEVAEKLKDMQELRSVFDIVLCVHVKHHSIQELMNGIEEEIHQWARRSSETDSSQIIVLDKFPRCLLFVDCSDVYIDLHDPELNLSKWFGAVQMVITSGSQNAYCPVDIEIRVEDHLLPWILFSMNVDLETLGKYSSIQQIAIHLIEKCHGHLLAIILLARSLRSVVDVNVWELALHELTSQKELSLGVTSDVMVRALRFIWSHMETLSQRCTIQFTSHYMVECEFKKSSLINSWIKDGLVNGEIEGERVLEDIIHSFLIEQVGEDCVRMRNEIRVILITYFVPRGYGLYPNQDGSKTSIMPNVEEWDVSWEIHFSNNIISKLPNNPNCPNLVTLFLHLNQDLIDIPITFFDSMPVLQVLDLSSTSIKCLPASISKLTTLRKLFIKDCDLLMELPPEIDALKNLKVFDSEGTQLVSLPKEVGSLIKLECLNFSLYNFAHKHKPSNPSMQIVPIADLAKLTRLKELHIYVDLYSEWWEEEVKSIINILPKFRNLKSLRLYFPTTQLLDMFIKTENWRGVPNYQQLSDFSFIVGHLQERVISRVPCDLLKIFLKLPKCLMYTNDEGDTKAISMALTNANAFFLDRNWTVQSLSAFGLVEMEKLKFCLLAECNEMSEIINGSHLKDYSLKRVFASLEHLSIHYMKSLTRILNATTDSACLSNLKTLAMHSCPELRTIFTLGFLDGLTCLEYLIVEDCTMISSLVSMQSYRWDLSTPCLPSLKKISLLHLPSLVSISRSLRIAPRLESLVVYDCPNLKELFYMEASDDLREIKGENEWWDALKWCEPKWTGGQPDYLARVFTPLGTDGDIMDELADAVNLLPHLSH